MKRLLAIILLLSMSLPNSVWASVMERCVPEGESCPVVQAASHCACCKPEVCACAPAPEQAPSKQLPSLPTRALAVGDLFLPSEVVTVCVPLMDRCSIAVIKPNTRYTLSVLGQSVPLYRRNCAVLC